MKHLPTKAEVRAELDKQMQDYLKKGGAVAAIPRGTSGHIGNTNPFVQSPASNTPKQDRTPINDVVQALDERKQNGKKNTTQKRRGPRKKLIVDDFGEPVRWVWVED